MMNNESVQTSIHLSKEYVFWFHVIRRKLAYYLPWNTPQQLVRVVVDKSHIRSDGPIWTDSQDVLDVSLPAIAQIKLSMSATAQNGGVEIITQETKHYLLIPTNPFDPTLLSYSNFDEMKAFIHVVGELQANRTPELDENPYRRQFQKKNPPAYLNDKIDFPWDKNVSPWEYYSQYVPASVDQKKHIVAKRYKIIVLSSLSIMILLALYAIYTQLAW